MNKRILIIFLKIVILLIKSIVVFISLYLIGSLFFDYEVIELIASYYIVFLLVAVVIVSILEVEIEDMENVLMQKIKKWHRYRKY